MEARAKWEVDHAHRPGNFCTSCGDVGTDEEPAGLVIEVRLSRRNLEALLAKLNGEPPNSNCTISRVFDMMTVEVVAEEDDTHYGERVPGRMHPDTEAALEGES